MVFIFTNKNDIHPTNVIKHLVSWGVPVFRLNTECLLTDYQFKWWCDENGCDFYIRNIKNNLEVYGHEITAVWERRAMIPKTLPITHRERSINKYNREEAHGFLSFLRYYMRDIYSIGSIVEDRSAESKMLQLAVAKSIGAKVPDTCYANYKSAFDDLCSKHEELSLKSINNDSIFIDGEKEYVFYSQKCKSTDLMKQAPEAFSQTACYLQNYIDKKYELRITVCCNDIVACKIDSQIQGETTGKIDWRQGYDYNLQQEIVEIPDSVKELCLSYLMKMKLNFGCFDFIVTPDDEYIFLECNPNGQWLWIELETGFDISKIVAINLSKNESVITSTVDC